MAYQWRNMQAITYEDAVGEPLDERLFSVADMERMRRRWTPTKLGEREDLDEHTGIHLSNAVRAKPATPYVSAQNRQKY